MPQYLATKYRKGLMGTKDKVLVDALGDGTAALDTISEKTSGAGVTADGVLLKDGGATLTGTLITGSSDVTISDPGASITATKTFHTVIGFGDAADTLSTITAGTNGQILILRAKNTATDITVDEVGNIVLAGSCVLDSSSDTLTLIYDSTLAKWIEISRSDNA